MTRKINFKGYLARDLNLGGGLFLYLEKPDRHLGGGVYFPNSDNPDDYLRIPHSGDKHEDVSWWDSPVNVEVTIKVKR